ncbi:MAG: hypothetical protein IT457_00065 [Planctomycetes bacterium]|nr:hypothetical protein [Planctomycetota bacterium]
MAFDILSGRVVLYGGLGSGGVLGDTWAFDGVDWAQLQPANGPPAGKAYHQMVSDLGRGRIVLYGGQPPSRPHWEWSGQDWQEQTSMVTPGFRTSAHGLAWDSARSRTVLHGGIDPFSSTYRGDTWEWDGAVWARRSDGSYGPGSRACMALVYSSIDDATLSYGGVQGTMVISDLWEWQSPLLASSVPHAPGCPGLVGEPELVPWPRGPWLNDSFSLQLVPRGITPLGAVMLTGFTASTWNGRSLPQALDNHGLPGCQLAIAAELSYPMSATPTGMFWTIQVPGLPSLGGLRFYNQAIALVPGANPAGAVMSASRESVIGAR